MDGAGSRLGLHPHGRRVLAGLGLSVWICHPWAHGRRPEGPGGQRLATPLTAALSSGTAQERAPGRRVRANQRPPRAERITGATPTDLARFSRRPPGVGPAQPIDDATRRLFLSGMTQGLAPGAAVEECRTTLEGKWCALTLVPARGTPRELHVRRADVDGAIRGSAQAATALRAILWEQIAAASYAPAPSSAPAASGTRT